MPGECPLFAGAAITGGHSDSSNSTGHHLCARCLHVARRLGLSSGASMLAFPLFSLSAHAQTSMQAAAMPIGTSEVIQLALSVGVMGTALITAIVLIRERQRMSAENVRLRTHIADVNAALQRQEAILNLRDQRIIVWDSATQKPELIGLLPPEAGAPEERATFLAFGRWLTPRSAATLERSIVALREKGTAFDIAAETHGGAPLEIQGRKAASLTLVRFLSLSENQRSQARLRLENKRLADSNETLTGLLDGLDMPVWLRDENGDLKWVNPAYSHATETTDTQEAIRQGKEFLGDQARTMIADKHRTSPIFAQIVSTVTFGDRRQYSVTHYNGPRGSAGLACDVSEIEMLRAEFERTVRNHSDTLDHLNTAVAIFDTDQKLRFFNQAFQNLWMLDIAFLNSAPDNALLLDRLRSEGKIAEQPEWRRWKENLLGVYMAVETQEHWWHLPDGKTIRVVANPQPKGGVTWLFENLTEKIDLESRYQTAVRVQGETLDNLAEGVAVFGPDGRLRLSNPAFAALWELDEGIIKPNVHVSLIRTSCDQRAKDSPWGGFVAAITGFDEERRNWHGLVELNSGSVLRYAAIHLPNGQMMTTFVDVTASVNVERALKEKNEALLKSDQIKNDFVQHVSYELRSPLTNIIGFTELLSLPATGLLSQRQREYVEHIGSSSSVLLTIVNDILDLATIDAGIMQLDMRQVNVKEAISATAELVFERLQEHAIKLDVDASTAPVSFHSDEVRLRQILYNLLINAANYAPVGSAIRLTCRQVPEGVEFAVHDDGPGMPPDVLDLVFQRFESRVNGGRRRGAGLGLSIVKSFVELHGGHVRIKTGEDKGTTVICTFPDRPAPDRPADMHDAAE
ncbi:ATP-binding protein [Aquamicrobium segne]|uniref:histidine kinase n=1 Tax=Aquamicrobium segne TaxID=469547 RepID=A0ABW0H1I4_9HYPH